MFYMNVRLTNSCNWPVGSATTGRDGANRSEKRYSARSFGERTAGILSIERISFKPMSLSTYQKIFLCGVV